MAASGDHIAADDSAQLSGAARRNGGLAERVGLGVEREVEFLASCETGGADRDVSSRSGLARHAIAGDRNLRADSLGQVNGGGGVGGLLLVVEAGQRRRGLSLVAAYHVPELGRRVLQVDGLGLPVTDLDNRLCSVLGALCHEIRRGVTLGSVDSTNGQRRRSTFIRGGLVDTDDTSQP